MAIFFDLLVLSVISGCGLLGFQRGIIPSVWMAMQVFISVSFGLLVGETLSSPISDGLRFLLEPLLPQGFPFEAWSVFLAFMIAAWGQLAALRWLLPGPVGSDDDLSAAEHIAGGIAGIVGGIVFVGGVLVTLSMQPAFRLLQPPANSLYCDAGRVVIGTAGKFTAVSHNDGAFVAFGEPAVVRANTSTKTTSEPWYDLDFNSQYDEGESFADIDGDSIFTKNLPYLDVDNNGSRLLGLYDKYRAGRWDFSLKSDNRDVDASAVFAPDEGEDVSSLPDDTTSNAEVAADDVQAAPPESDGRPAVSPPMSIKPSTPPTESSPVKDPLDDF